MWKVTRECEWGLVGEEEYRSWVGAKEEFRYTITEKLGAEGIERFIEQIDDYCDEFYPDGAPSEIETLKTVLTKLVVDPEYPQNPEEFTFDDFEDDNIEFYMADNKKIFVYVNNDDVAEKFPSAEINAICFDDPDDEYFFFITDNKDPLGSTHYSTNITLAPAEE